MKAIIFFLAAALTCTVSLAQNSSGPLNFLELGKDYEIQFPDGANVIPRSYIDESADGTGKALKRRPTPLFHVVKVSNGSWALLEFPVDPADYAKWNTKRDEASQFTKERTEIAKEDSKRQETLLRLKQEINSVRTSDAPLSTRDLKAKPLLETVDTLKQEVEQSLKTLNAISVRQAEFNKELAREIKTRKTWVNLEHAISITEALPKAEPIAGVKAFTLDFTWWVGDAK